MRKVSDEDHRHWHHRHQRLSENLKCEIHRDKSNRDARQRRQERGARRHPPHALGDERGGNLDDAVEKASDEPDFPGPHRVLGLLDNRQHNEKNESEQTYGVDAVGQCGDVVAPGLAREPARLPCIEKIADENRNRRAGKNLAENVFIRQPNQLATKSYDKDQLNQIIDHQAEKAVEIFTHKPGWIEGSLRHVIRILLQNFRRM